MWKRHRYRRRAKCTFVPWKIPGVFPSPTRGELRQRTYGDAAPSTHSYGVGTSSYCGEGAGAIRTADRVRSARPQNCSAMATALKSAEALLIVS